MQEDVSAQQEVTKLVARSLAGASFPLFLYTLKIPKHLSEAYWLTASKKAF